MTPEVARDRLDVEATVEMYIASRIRSRRPVSTSDAIKAIRTALPTCKLDDRSLVDLVAGSAVRNRQDIIFDPLDDNL